MLCFLKSTPQSKHSVITAASAIANMLANTQFQRVSAKSLRDRNRVQRLMLDSANHRYESAADSVGHQSDYEHDQLSNQDDDRKSNEKSGTASPFEFQYLKWHVEQEQHYEQLKSQLDEQMQTNQALMTENEALRKQCDHFRESQRRLEMEFDEYTEHDQQLMADQSMQLNRLQKKLQSTEADNKRLRHQRRQLCTLIERIKPLGRVRKSRKHYKHLQHPTTKRNRYTTTNSPVHQSAIGGRESPIESDGWAEELLHELAVSEDDEQDFWKQMTFDPWTETNCELKPMNRSPIRPMHNLCDLCRETIGLTDRHVNRSHKLKPHSCSSASTSDLDEVIEASDEKEDEFYSVCDRFVSRDPTSLKHFANESIDVKSHGNSLNRSANTSQPIDYLSLDFESECGDQRRSSFDASDAKLMVNADHQVFDDDQLAKTKEMSPVSEEQLVLQRDNLPKGSEATNTAASKELNGPDRRCRCAPNGSGESYCEQRLRKAHREYLLLNEYLSSVKHSLADVDKMLLALCYRFGLEKRILNQYFDFCVFGLSMEEYFKSIQFKIRLLFTRKLQVDVTSLNQLIRKGTIHGRFSNKPGDDTSRVGLYLTELDAMNTLIRCQHNRLLRIVH